MLNLHRQLDFLNPDVVDIPNINIIGCGGIGSYVAYYLAQMGIDKLTVWDRDKVEEHNVSNQNFTLSQIGQFKVDAIRESIVEKTGETINVKRHFFNSESQIKDGIVIFATDSINSRKLIYNVIKDVPEITYMIDGRLGGELCAVLSIDMADNDQKKLYESSLFPSSEAEGLPCTGKAVIYVAARIAAEITYHVKQAIHDPSKCNTNILIDWVNNYMEVDNKPFFMNANE